MVKGGRDDDAKLMARFVQTRDRRMFEQLFSTHRRAMVAYAGRYVRNPARAEELAQEIFLRVYTTKSYTPTATFKTWLYRVATNVCLNELRKSEHKQQIESMDDTAEDGYAKTQLAAPPSASPEAQAHGNLLASQLEAALMALPDNQRAAFLMARHEGLSHEEIAEALSTSVSAVKSLVHRALETLRDRAKTAMQSPEVTT